MASTTTGRFSGKVITITGAASGIGFATALELASLGATLSLADIDEPALAAAADRIKSEHPSATLLTTTLDVRDAPAVNAWIARTKSEFGPLDGAANMAGVVGKNLMISTIETQDEDEWTHVIDVNLTGLMHCLRAEAPAFREKGGSIVNAASIAGQQGRPGSAAYTASKHGVIGLTRSAAKEWGPRLLRCNCIAPGYIDTPMMHNAAARLGKDFKDPTINPGLLLSPMKRLGTAEECAKMIIFLLSDDTSYVTGAVFNLDGGINC